MENTQEVLSQDPWVDEFTQLDLSNGPKHIANLDQPVEEQIVEDEPVAEAGPEVETAPEPKPAPEPEVYQYDDGSSVTFEKTKKGWVAILDSATGAAPEKFYGTTKDEMMLNMAAGKIHATKKIREQNRTIKLNAPVSQPQETPRQTQTRDLSADDIFDLKAKLEENPGQAIESYFEKKYGRKISDILDSADRGDAAQMALAREQYGLEFAQRNPDYYKNNDNYVSMMKWLAKFKLQKNLTDTNEAAILNELTVRGLYTVDTLTEAFEDLKESGLITFAPRAPEPEEVEEEEVPKPAPTPRTETVRRPRPAVGIRTSDVRPAPRPQAIPDAPDKLDDLTDAQIAELYAGVQKLNREKPDFVKSNIQATRERYRG